ncbi:MAG: DUF29 domain-containing protein [Prochlorotrichaceae cyanobacterium]|jgi:hypothetical protein
MVTELQKTSLYEQDFLLWSEDTVAKLRARDFENLDLENLIEEVESLGRSDRKELLSRLVVIFEHLLKRLYVQLPEDYNGWERTVRTQRTDLRFLIKSSPSLKSIWNEYVQEAWSVALETVREDYPQVTFPDRFPYSTDVETLLNQRYWEIES